ncbi:hypothetical protein ACLOJK_022420 [Asimina triloba]
MYIDPCAPRGYSHDMRSLILPADSDAKSSYLPAIDSRGNFTQCRHAALKLLQKGRAMLFCGEDWFELKKKHHAINDEDLMRYCFSSAYIVAFLHDSLGVPLHDERIAFANQVGDIPLDWAVGAFIMLRAADSDAEGLDWVVGMVGDDSSAPLSLFIVSAALIFIAWLVSKWRKPQLKTIYDLEKVDVLKPTLEHSLWQQMTLQHRNENLGQKSCGGKDTILHLDEAACSGLAHLVNEWPDSPHPLLSYFQNPVLAEAIATFLLVFVTCGSAALSASNEHAISKLGASVAGGLIVTVMIYSVGHISGAHMNPAVTLAFAAVRRFPWKQVAKYQCSARLEKQESAS